MERSDGKAVIITGYIENPLDINELISDGDFIICADGGYDIAKSQNIVPDLLLGDFDSVISDLPGDITTVRFDPEKDYTDTDLAFKEAVRRGFREVSVIGGIGGRLDHTVANIQTMTAYSRRLKKAVLMDGRNEYFVLEAPPERSAVLAPREDAYLSVVSLSDSARVTLKDLKYEACELTLSRDFPLGTSNEFTSRPAEIILHEGTLLVMLCRK